MALNAAIVWEVRTTGNDANGGGFKAGAAGTDYSQQDAAQKSGADLTMHASTNTKVSPVAAKVAAADVGNVIYIASGTDWTPGFYEITAQDGGDPGYWTLDRSPSAAANANLATYKMGGALASPGMAGYGHVAGNDIHIKSGTYTITTASVNVSSGCLDVISGTGTTGQTRVIGYSTSRWDFGTQPLLQLASDTVSSATAVLSDGNYQQVYNLATDGNLNTSSRGFYSANSTGLIYKCKATKCTNNGILTNGGNCVFCYVTECTTQPAFSTSSSVTIACEAYANAVTGFYSNGTTAHAWINCISYANTGAASKGFDSTDRMSAVNCTSYGNGSDGFGLGSHAKFVINCVAEGNAGYGFNASSATSEGILLINCAVYNNTSGSTRYLDANLVIGLITASASVFTNAASGDFSLNTSANGGALLRAAGFPSTFPRGTTESYYDIGAAQHADPASGGGGFPILGGSVVR